MATPPLSLTSPAQSCPAPGRTWSQDRLGWCLLGLSLGSLVAAQGLKVQGLGLGRQVWAGPGVWEGTPPAADQRQRPKPGEVKAALLYKLIKYTAWPASAFPNAEAPLVILVLGPDPFEGALESVLANKQLHGRSLSVLRSAAVPEQIAAHLVFVGGLPAAGITATLSACRARPILTVSESPGFARQGGFVHLFEKQGKPRFEINIDRQEDTGLSLDVELLKLADIFTEKARHLKPPQGPAGSIGAGAG